MEPETVAITLSECRDMLLCPVCLNRYDDGEHLPKLLNCHHTICFACLSVVFAEVHRPNQFFWEPRRPAKRCPQCRSLIHIISEIDKMPTNFYIQTLRQAVSNAQQQTQDGSNKREGQSEFPECSIHAVDNIATPATSWCEECDESLCSMCVVEGHATDHTVVLVTEKARRLGDEIEALRKEIAEIRRNSEENKESLLQKLSQFSQLVEDILYSIKEDEENVIRSIANLAEESETLRMRRPYDIRRLRDYAQKMRRAKVNVQLCVENNNLENIDLKLEEMMSALRIQNEID